MPVKDYNADPDLNTQISGINIAEGCAPSGINNAIRQLMADVKEGFESEEEAVSSLDTSLRALIAQEVAKYLPLAGGVMTGDDAIIFDKAGHVTALAGKQDGTTRLSFSAGGPNGSFINLIGQEFDSEVAGGVQLVGVSSEGALTIFEVFPAGIVRINGKHVARLVNGLEAGADGAIKGTFILDQGFLAQRDVNNSFVILSGGNSYLNGAYLQLYGGDHSSGGGFTLSAGKDGAYQLICNATSGNLYWRGNRLVAGADFITGASGTASTYTLPSGGSWRYVSIRENRNLGGIVAGGTTLDVGTSAIIFAVKVA